jgi:hypothetical protein
MVCTSIIHKYYIRYEKSKLDLYIALHYSSIIPQPDRKMEKIMSFLDLAFPAVSALPTAQVALSTIAGAARPLLGLGILATVFIVFKPLIVGMLRAALLLLQPKLTREQKTASRNLRNLLTIRRISNDFDSTSPSMAAELRALAARG